MKESNLSELLNRRLALLGEADHLSLLTRCLHGIERETLRVIADQYGAPTGAEYGDRVGRWAAAMLRAQAPARRRFHNRARTANRRVAWLPTTPPAGISL